MTDEFFNNSDGKGSARRLVDALLQRLRENPELAADPQFQAQLNQALAAERSSQTHSVSSDQTKSVLPTAPFGLPIAGKSSSRTQVPSGLPSARPTPPPFGFPAALPTATRTNATDAALPDANRRVDFKLSPTPTLNETKLEPPAPTSVTDATLPQTVEAPRPVVVPVPPSRESKPVQIDPTSVPTRKSRKKIKTDPTKRDSDVAPDLSKITAKPEQRAETDFATLGALVAAPRSTTFVATSSSLPPSESLGALTAEESWEKSTPDAFLELLEKRNPRPADTEESAQQVALLHDQSALERAANDAPMWLVSLLLHLILIVILAFLVVNVELKDLFQVVSEPGFSDEVVLDDVFDPDAAFETIEDANLDVTDMPEVEAETVADVPDVSAFTEETAASLTMTETALALDSAPVGDVENLLGSLNGDDLSGRGQNKAAALAQGAARKGARSRSRSRSHGSQSISFPTDRGRIS